MDKKIELLTPSNSVLLLIDYQPQMAFGVVNIDRQTLKNNAVALAKAAKIFKVPTILTSVETKSFSGLYWPELLDVYPDHNVIERTSMNSWDSETVRKHVAETKKKKLILGGLWTEVCINMCAFSAMQDSYELYVVEDACGGTSKDAHKWSMARMVQAGVIPMTWQQLLLEWQRDWAHKETYNATMDLVREHSGAYGMGVDYAYTLVHGQPSRAKWHGKLIK
ncbi:Isochorismatase family protein [Legionella massiliensis]|uniref:Isochorismatase family protein n=1 Tax=Legionella massiliensis TaxID=1034943 RepID=A0A078KTW9_9GAMM|nr:hydrolase [Legionella massiliensis]CDZ76481.1 Isochorismatase family protein [Legionella massiliensis]CEE12219.1 Isochorismatase family protein [Legionella massiliensis]